MAPPAPPPAPRPRARAAQVDRADDITDVLPRQRAARTEWVAPAVPAPLAGPPSRRGRHRPVRTFHAVGAFVLVIGAISGIYLGFNRPAPVEHPVTVLAVATPTLSAAPDTAREKAFADAQAKAAAAAAAAAEQAKKANDLAAREQAASRSDNRSAPYPVPASCNEYAGNRAVGCALLLEAGFGLDQMPCLDKLFTKESGWNPKARNPSSGAYGIPQALPGDKMATYGSDWQTNPVPQIKWGLNYIKNRYKTPCDAWSHSQATGWY